jgi:hypothetical protein
MFMLCSRPKEGLKSKTIRLFNTLDEAINYAAQHDVYRWCGKIYELFGDKEPVLVKQFEITVYPNGEWK